MCQKKKVLLVVTRYNYIGLGNNIMAWGRVVPLWGTPFGGGVVQPFSPKLSHYEGAWSTGGHTYPEESYLCIGSPS